jgi:hypothetical protein
LTTAFQIEFRFDFPFHFALFGPNEAKLAGEILGFAPLHPLFAQLAPHYLALVRVDYAQACTQAISLAKRLANTPRVVHMGSGAANLIAENRQKVMNGRSGTQT